jgi:hypothetical protein
LSFGIDGPKRPIVFVITLFSPLIAIDRTRLFYVSVRSAADAPVCPVGRGGPKHLDREG